MRSVPNATLLLHPPDRTMAHSDAIAFDPVDVGGGFAEKSVMSEMISTICGYLHDGPTLAEIEEHLRADGRSQEQIDMSLAVILIVREELARQGKWPPPKPEYLS